jgi:tetratricopeptide (TPR) repeat protein
MQTPVTVQSLALNGQFQLGIELFASLSSASPSETRWAGVCWYNLGAYLKSKDLLLRARALGDVAACIELASVHRLLGDPQRALLFLSEVGTELANLELANLERVLFHREHGILALITGDVREALLHLEEAWALVPLCSFSSVHSAVAQALAFAHRAHGQDGHALHYLQEALGVPNLPASRQARILVTKAACLTDLGHFAQARSCLEISAGLLPSVPSLAALLEYQLGVLERACNRAAQALVHFDRALVLANHLEPETTCYTELQACAIETACGDFVAAERRLQHAQLLVGAVGPKALGLLELRRGALLCAQQQAEAGVWLTRSLARFERLGLRTEIGCVCLHLAEHWLRTDEPVRARGVLERAGTLRTVLGSDAMLIELTGLPLTLEFLLGAAESGWVQALLSHWQRNPETPAYLVELRTLGTAELRLNGRPVGLDIRKTIELLAYLLEYPGRNREQILADVFANKSLNQAVNYFHQARFNLERASGLLEVRHDKLRGTYRVHCSAPILLWDVRTVREELRRGRIGVALERIHGPFLANAESDWVQLERQRLLQETTSIGLRHLAQSRADPLELLAVVVRLRELDPLHPLLAQHLIRLTHASLGETMADTTLRRVQNDFLTEVGEVPSELGSVAQVLMAVSHAP